MGYHLWIGTMESVSKYGDFSNNDAHQIDMFGNTTHDLAVPIYINGVGSFNIEDIDLLTAQFKNEKEFREWANEVNFGSLKDADGKVMITHKYKGLREDPVVYDSPLLVSCATEVKAKKTNGYLEADIWLSRNDELLALAKRIAKYLKNKELRGGLLRLDFIPKLSEGLVGYARSCDLGNEKNDKENFEAIYTGCLRYSSLRKFLVWEKEHLLAEKTRKRQIALEKEEIREEERDAQEVRFRPITNPDILEIYEDMRTPEGEIDWDRVWREKSTDDVYKFGNDSELQDIGLKSSDASMGDSTIKNKGKKK